MPKVSTPKTPLPPRFYWALLAFLCLFGFTAWLLHIDAGAEIAGVLSLAVSVIALVGTPTGSRSMMTGALVTAAVLVGVVAGGFFLHTEFGSVDVTGKVVFAGAPENQPRLLDGEEVPFTITTDEPRANLEITFESVDFQDCATDPMTKVDLEVGRSSAEDMRSGESRTVPVHETAEIEGSVVMHAPEGCRMQLNVVEAELQS